MYVCRLRNIYNADQCLRIKENVSLSLDDYCGIIFIRGSECSLLAKL